MIRTPYLRWFPVCPNYRQPFRDVNQRARTPYRMPGRPAAGAGADGDGQPPAGASGAVPVPALGRADSANTPTLLSDVRVRVYNVDQDMQTTPTARPPRRQSGPDPFSRFLGVSFKATFVPDLHPWLSGAPHPGLTDSSGHCIARAICEIHDFFFDDVTGSAEDDLFRRIAEAPDDWPSLVSQVMRLAKETGVKGLFKRNQGAAARLMWRTLQLLHLLFTARMLLAGAKSADEVDASFILNSSPTTVRLLAHAQDDLDRVLRSKRFLLDDEMRQALWDADEARRVMEYLRDEHGLQPESSSRYLLRQERMPLWNTQRGHAGRKREVDVRVRTWTTYILALMLRSIPRALGVWNGSFPEHKYTPKDPASHYRRDRRCLVDDLRRAGVPLLE